MNCIIDVSKDRIAFLLRVKKFNDKTLLGPLNREDKFTRILRNVDK